MNVKTFQAGTIADALAKVKQELGASAVILHTRSFKTGGVMGLGARNVVEITAGMNINAPARKKTAAPMQSAAVAAALKARREAANDSTAGGVAVAERHPLKSAYATTRPTNRFQESGPNTETRQLAATMLKEPAFELRNEISSLKTMVESLLQRTATTGKRAELPETLAKLYTQLIEQQVSDEIAYRVVDDVKAELAPDQLTNPAAVRERLTGKLEQLLPANLTAGAARPATGTGCRSICLIGPTGVGKTTTIAKLAAAFKLRQKQKVGLITIDTYRIAAVDQLRTSANIIGVPLKVVLTPAELVAAMREMSDCDTILIDTAGRSHADQLKLNELSQFIAAAKPTEVHLVLASTTTQESMEAALEKFSSVRVDQIIFTKLDEAVSFGILLNVARTASRALSYVTTGQDVPDNIEVGQPRRLARLILGEKL
ncbi:MAG TPA: flagellar biosynthesis protein FlhF [Phycisphaerae bacterium]|nr:flagellar biosynthesis protein FlhF [Phycisphaerae bacterium]